MRIMAFDYGNKRVGVAVTDPLQIIANALITMHPDQIWPFLATYLQTEQIELFVVGMPVQLDGKPSQSAQHVKGFVKKLKRTYPGIGVELIDERFTSKLASDAIRDSGAKQQQRRDKTLVDAVAATIILQSFMERRDLGNAN